ncbi:hypothetical protein FCV25MIE_21774 [Fagus crenata]
MEEQTAIVVLEEELMVIDAQMISSQTTLSNNLHSNSMPDKKFSSLVSKKNKCPISEYIVPDKDEEQEENYKNNKHLCLRRELETQSQFPPRKTITSQREKDGISSASKFKKKKSYSKPHVAVFVAANVDPNSNPQHFKKKKNDHTVSLSSSNLQPLASDVLQSQSLAVNLDFIFQIFAYRIDELEIKL